jgi:hypothetical protein
MADHISITTPVHGSPSRISWGSVIAGVVVAFAVLSCLSYLVMAFGLTLLKPQDPGHDDAVSTIAVTGVVAWIASALIALFTGGWAAAHLARQTNEADSVIHGALVWGLSIIAMMVVGATAGGALVGGAFSLVSSGMTATGTAVGGIARGAGATAGGLTQAAAKMEGMPEFNWDSIKFQAQSLMRGHPATAQDRGGVGLQQNNNNGAPQAEQPGAGAGTDNQANSANANGQQQAQGVQQQANGQQQAQGVQQQANGQQPQGADSLALMKRVFGAPGGALSEQDRSAVVAMLTGTAGLSQEEATKQVQAWENARQQASAEFESLKAEAERKARAAAATAAKTLADAAWIAFVASILAGSAAMLGAHLGGRKNVRLTKHQRHPEGAALAH